MEISRFFTSVFTAGGWGRRVRALVACAVCAVCAVCAGAIGMVSPSGAAASSYGPYLTLASPSLNERSAPSTSASITGSLPYHSQIYVQCQTTGTSVDGSDIWDLLTTGSYVSDYWINTPNVGKFSPPIPQCGVAQPVTITTPSNVSSPPNTTVGTPYSFTFSASGGNGSYSWSVVSGASNIPPGLSLASNGVISGTPTQVAKGGSFAVQVSSGGQTAEKAFTIWALPGSSAVTITTPSNVSSPPNATVGAPYSFTFSAGGGNGSYSWSVVSGASNIPPGLSLASNGVISGTPTQVAKGGSFTVQVSSAGQSAQRAFTIWALGGSVTPVPVIGFGDSIAAGYGNDSASQYGPGAVNSRFAHGPGCSNTPDAYPCQLAQSLTGSSSTSDNFAVQGATSGQVLSIELPLALNTINSAQQRATVKTVTLTVGADDIGFSGCLTQEFQPTYPVTDACIGGTLANLQLSSSAQSEVSALTSNVAQFLRLIHADFPNAKIAVTGYYNPLPGPVASGGTACALFALPTAYYAYSLAQTSLEAAVVELANFNYYQGQFQNRFYQVANFLEGQLNSAISSAVSQASLGSIAGQVGLDSFNSNGVCSSNPWVFSPVVSATVNGHQVINTNPVRCPFPGSGEVNQSKAISIVSVSFSSNCIPHPTQYGQSRIAASIAASPW